MCFQSPPALPNATKCYFITTPYKVNLQEARQTTGKPCKFCSRCKWTATDCSLKDISIHCFKDKENNLSNQQQSIINGAAVKSSTATTQKLSKIDYESPIGQNHGNDGIIQNPGRGEGGSTWLFVLSDKRNSGINVKHNIHHFDSPTDCWPEGLGLAHLTGGKRIYWKSEATVPSAEDRQESRQHKHSQKTSSQKVFCPGLSYINSLKESKTPQVLEAELQCKGACLQVQKDLRGQGIFAIASYKVILYPPF